MNMANGGEGVGGFAVEGGGRSGHANRCDTNRAHTFAVSSLP